MKLHGRFWAILLAPVVLIFQGCANKGGYVQLHEGPPLHPSEKAIVKGHYAYRNGSLANEMIRIVEVDGVKVPGQWFVAEGADKVSLRPGFYQLKLLYVHGHDIIDFYSYTTIPVQLRANCTYQVIANWSSAEKQVMFSLVGKPSSSSGNMDCGGGIKPEEKPRSA